MFQALDLALTLTRAPLSTPRSVSLHSLTLLQPQQTLIEQPGQAAPPVAVRDLYQRSADEPILAATSMGLFESTDAETWRPLLLDGKDGLYAVTSTVNGASGHQLVAASAMGMSISRDRGRNWSAVKLDGGKGLRIRNITASPSDPQQLLAATEEGLLRSSDGGTSSSPPCDANWIVAAVVSSDEIE